MKYYNQRGLTLLEVLISLALVNLVTGMGFIALSYLNKELSQIDKNIQNQGDKITVAKSFAILSKNIGYSFNNIKYDDDNKLNFFDLMSDVSSMYYEKTKTRSVKFSYDSKNNEIFFISTDFQKGKLMFYDPTYAYSFDDPNDIDTSPIVSYEALNKEFKEGSGYVKANTEAWIKDQLFLLITPVQLRKKELNKTVDFLNPPRFLSFVGIVNDKATDILKLDIDPFKSLFFNFNPMTEKDLKSPDDFFRELPTVGGSYPIVSLIPIKIVSFKIYPKVSSQGGKYIDVYKIEYNGFKKKSETFVLGQLKSIEFYRRNISLPNIDVKLEGL
ncbi:MAG: prepilin-type N-terminal cleavage/methylation domain-containing protein [Bdellovibrionaceae bacterium]|nr:prepilin-type N-terminal cleavage/methylation domain-containing protein [Pseudobdellovibrionaceae bacterium]